MTPIKHFNNKKEFEFLIKKRKYLKNKMIKYKPKEQIVLIIAINKTYRIN